MARRRLNTKVFAIIIGVIVVGGLVYAALATFLRAKSDPRVLEARGDAAFEQADYRESYEQLRAAVALEPKNAALRVKLGDVCVKLTREDPNFLRLAHTNWSDAIAIDSRHKPALERLITSLWEQVELGGDGGEGLGQVFAQIRTRADQLIAVDPDNNQARTWRHVATVRQSLSARSVPVEELEVSVQALRDLAKTDPANSEAPFYVAKARIQAGQDSLADRRPDLANQAFDEARDVMLAAVANGQEKNAAVQFRAHQIFVNLAKVDPRAGEDGGEYRKLAADAIAAAAASDLNDSLKNRDEIVLQWADWLAIDGKPDEARKVRENFFVKNPDNQRARLAWARTLAMKKEDRPQALEILSKDTPLPSSVVGAGVWIHREFQAQALNELIMIRLGDAEVERDPEKREKILAAIDEPLDKLKRIASPKAPKVLGIEGQVLLARGRAVEAVQVMSEAVRQFRQGAKDYVLMYVLARTYADRTNQPGSARALCEEIIRDNPKGFLAARGLLAELLIRENRLSQAVVQLDAIRKQNKDYPDLARLENMARLLQGGTNPTKAGGVAEKLPESDNRQRWAKYEFVRIANLPDEQIRLLNAILAEDPKDTRAVITLVQLYRTRDFTERAKEVVAQAVQANPDDATLKLLQLEITGTAAADLREKAKEQIRATHAKDPFQLNMRLYELERLPGGDPKASLTYLLEARKLKPDDRGVLDTLFREHLARRQFAEAKPLLDKLVAQNADGVSGLLYQHRYAVSRGEFIEAERIGVELVERYTEFAQSWLALGQAQEALAKWPEAIRSFTEVLARQPTNYEAMRTLIDVYYYAGMTDEAETKLREMRGLFGTDPVVRELYLNHLANFGKPEEAIPEREEQVRKAPKDPWGYLALAATYFKNAQKMASQNKLDDSKKQIDLAFNTLWVGRAQFPEDARFYAQVAEIHQYNGKADQAEQVLHAFAQQELTKVAPAKIRPDPWLALADFYSRINKPEAAVTALNEALVRSDNSLDVRLRLVNAMVQAKQFEDATRTLDAVRDDPDPRIARQRMEILVAQGTGGPAEKEIRAALTQRDGPDLRNLLASVLIDGNRLDEALVELDRSAALDPRNEATRYLRAMALSRKPPADTNLPLAIAELIELKKSSQRNPVQTRLLLAELYDRSGKRKQAIQELADALQKTPGSKELRLALIRLYRAERPPQFQAAHALVAMAENDPVLRTDPAWPREAAMLFADQRQLEPAIVKMNQAVQLAPGNQDYRRELIELQIRFNGFAGALVQSDQLLRQGVNTWWLRTQRGVATARQISKATLAQSRTDPALAAKVKETQAQALEEFDQALKLTQGDPDRTATVLRRIGETVGYNEALARLAPMLANDPTNEWKLLSLAFKRSNNDFAGAAADGERMLADPSNGPNRPERRAAILRALSDVYQSSNPPDFAKARDRYVELLRIIPDDITALNNLAYILAEKLTPPDPSAARDYSRQAFELTRKTNDPNPMILDTHGWVLVLSGGIDAKQGLQVLQAVATQFPFFVEVHYHLGEAYLRQTPAMVPEAVKHLSEALRLIEEEEKLGIDVNASLKDRVQTSLGKAKQAG